MKAQKRNNNRSSRIASNIRRAVAEILLTEFAEDSIISRVSLTDAVDGIVFIKLADPYHSRYLLTPRGEYSTIGSYEDLLSRYRNNYFPVHIGLQE